MKKIYIGLIGFALGVLANSVNIKTESFRFNNPFPYKQNVTYSTIDSKGNMQSVTNEEPLSGSGIERIVEARQLMTDTEISLNIFGAEIPVCIERQVEDVSNRGRGFKGIVSGNGDVRAIEGVHKLQSAHDYFWYGK